MFFKEEMIFCSYARTAIYLAMLTIGVRNKEVIIPAFTCMTTLPPAIRYAGGIPVFVDIRKENLEIDINDLRKKVTSNTKAIISHHYYGAVTSNIQEIQDFAEENGLVHVEDCAHSWGGIFNKKFVGNIGDIAVFSFSKSLINPAGGAIQFKDKGLCIRAGEIQRENTQRLHEFISNVDTFVYLNKIAVDRKKLNQDICNEMPNFIKVFMVRLINHFGLYNSFIFDNEKGLSSKSIYDTRMTIKQKIYIDNCLKNFQMILKKRLYTAKNLNCFLKSYFTESTFPYYVIMLPEISKYEKIFRSISVRTRRVWPFFQKYHKIQLTENVKWIRDYMLIIDIDDIDDKKIERIKKYYGMLNK